MLHRVLLGVVAAGLIGVMNPAPAAASITNDDRADAIALSDPSGWVKVDFVGATSEPEDPWGSMGTVWYSFTSTVTDRYSFYMYYSDVSYWASFGAYGVFIEGEDGSLTVPTAVGGGYREQQFLVSAGDMVLIGFGIGGDALYWGDSAPVFSWQRAPLLHLGGTVDAAETTKRDGELVVTGTTSCNVDADVSLELTVTQGDRRRTVSAYGSISSLFCVGGSPSTWQLTLRPAPGEKFKRGAQVTTELHLTGYDVAFFDWDEVTLRSSLVPR
jgi:hypothetical protein